MITPSLLVWAREEAGYGPDEAAALADIPKVKLIAWESGEKQPSLRQAEKLAKLYDRSLGVLSLPQPPALPALATEYRHLPGVKPGAEPPALRRAVRRLVQRRRIAMHLLAELGEEPSDFSLNLHIDDDPEKVARTIREALGISLQSQLGWNSEFVAYRAWRLAVEQLGVLVCQFPGKETGDVRGLGILHFPLPVIGISSKEIPLAKPFTLLHELVHLGLSASREELPAQSEKRNQKEWLQVERFCESVASSILMPEAAIRHDADVKIQKSSEEWTVGGMRRAAKRFRVTPSAVATRLLWMGLMSPSDYAGWKKDWAEWRKSHPEGPGFGIASPADKAVGRSGPYFTSLVLGALGAERISSVDASQYLDLGFNHVESLRKDWMNSPGIFAGAAIS
jgi:Zn-dependent peptidase ImmA (M78 family)/DNA-binding XRE family transcriptional regulator